ncbi:hypothetical protein, partial [Medusavirus stheno T3]
VHSGPLKKVTECGTCLAPITMPSRPELFGPSDSNTRFQTGNLFGFPTPGSSPFRLSDM